MFTYNGKDVVDVDFGETVVDPETGETFVVEGVKLYDDMSFTLVDEFDGEHAYDPGQEIVRPTNETQMLYALLDLYATRKYGRCNAEPECRQERNGDLPDCEACLDKIRQIILGGAGRAS